MGGALIAEFTKRFGGGAVIRSKLNRAANGHSITVLFGPSGCGKTTVLRCLAGLEQPEEGIIEFDGTVWFDAARGISLRPQQRNVGFVFQDYALFPHLTVVDNIAYGLHGLAAAERQRRVGELLERFALGAQARQRPRQLSGGQQQRVALARALACRPKMLLLDEPLSALDSSLREQLRGELRQLLAECGIPVLLVTHDRDEALALGDELVVMSNGTMRQTGPVMEVFNRPADAEVARIVRVETLQPGRVVSVSDGLAVVEVGATRVHAPAPSSDIRDVLVCIRGEDVVLQRNDAAPGSVHNRLPARVMSVQPGSPLLRVELDAGFPLSAYIARPASEELALRPGDFITALVKTPAVHLIPREP